MADGPILMAAWVRAAAEEVPRFLLVVRVRTGDLLRRLLAVCCTHVLEPAYITLTRTFVCAARVEVLCRVA